MREPRSTPPQSNAHRQAGVRARAIEAGGKTVVVQLTSPGCEALAEVRAAIDATSDRAAIEAAVLLARDTLRSQKP